MTLTKQAKDALVERLTGLMAKCPVLPIAARPLEHDDWGLIRTTHATEDGFHPVFARANIPWDDTSDAKLNEHRRNKTDPTQDAMDLIVEGLNALPDLLAALASASLPVEQGWWDISSAPKDGTKFDGWSRHGFRVADVVWEDRYQSFFSNEDGAYLDLTHWLPLPTPPVVIGEATPVSG